MMGSARQIATAFGLVALLSLSGASAGVCRPGSSATTLTTTAVTESTTAATTDLTISVSSGTTVLTSATSESSASESATSQSTTATSESIVSESITLSTTTASASTISESTSATGTTASETISTTSSAPASTQTYPAPSEFYVGFLGGGTTDASRLDGFPIGQSEEFIGAASRYGGVHFSLSPEGYLVSTSAEFIVVQRPSAGNNWVLLIYGTPSNFDTDLYVPLVCTGVKGVNGVATALECTGADPTYTRLLVCDDLGDADDTSRGERYLYLGNSLQEKCLDARFALRSDNN